VPRRIHRTRSLSSSRSPGSIGRSIASVLLALPALALFPPAAGGSEGHEAPVANLVINEIMKDPVVVPDAHGEYIEIYNAGSFTVDLNDWTIRDLGGDEHRIAAGEPLPVEPGGFVVLARDSSSSENGGFTADYEYSGFTLSNGSDEVILVNPSGEVADSVGYDSVGYPDRPGCALELRNPEFDNAPGTNWRAAGTAFGLGDLGTPGSTNSAWESYKVVTLDVESDTLDARIGDMVQLGVLVAGQSDDPAAVTLYGDLWLPDGGFFPANPLFGPARLELAPGELRVKTLHMNLDGRVTPGDYRLEGHLLDDAGEEIDVEEVVIRVVEAGSPPVVSWEERRSAGTAARAGVPPETVGE
jgi:hypothetical protein